MWASVRSGYPGRETRTAAATPYPSCPMRGKTMFLHHDMDLYSSYRCCDKKCNHAMFAPKPTAVSALSMSRLFGKADFKRMRYPVHVILMALSMFT